MNNIRVGIFGARRGANFIKSLLENNAEIVAICDKKESYIKEAQKTIGDTATEYSDFDEFLNHPMDAVVIANYFHEHTPYAIRCLEKNIHVFCECTSNSTMAEGVKLVRAAEKSKAFFMLAENYVFMLFNQEMKKIYDSGTLGKVLYAEGEYNHPGDPYNAEGKDILFDSTKHWRNFLPRTYYITHALAPLVYNTGSLPVRVSAIPVYSPVPEDAISASHVGDKFAVITCQNHDNSAFRVFGHSSFGGCENSYRICGEKGQTENIRGLVDTVSVLYNDWDIPEGKERYTSYKVEPQGQEADFVKQAGHGGGDFYVVSKFLECIRTNTKPVMDVYFATRLASVAIQAHRSLLDGGVPYDIPDFRNEEDRVKYENDNDSPFWYSDGRAPTLPCCSNSDYKPNDVQISKFCEAINLNK